MTNTSHDVQVDLILPGVSTFSRKQAFEILSKKIASKISCPADDIFMRLMSGERISPSGIGDGVAIPHMKLGRLSSPFAALATLNKPVSFDAADGKDVDIVYIVISPEDDGTQHLLRLSRISRILQNRELGRRVRESKDAESIRALLAAPGEWMMAA